MMMKEALEGTFRDLAQYDSTSGHEGEIASRVNDRLLALGLQTKIDGIGNVIGFLPGIGKPILLNAHMDGVPPGKGLIPIKEGSVLKGDGNTNLRADDLAGVSIILEATRAIVEEQRPHPPLVEIFTGQEENGLWGSKAADVTEYGVDQGIVFDNAFEAGAVVSRGAAYVAFDVEIAGKETHPGKDLSQGANAIQVLMDTGIRMGETDNGQTRINIGTVSAGKARNIVPGTLTLQGEVRSYLKDQDLKSRIARLQDAFQEAAAKNGATINFSTKQLALAYDVDPNEPLIQAYRKVIEARGGVLEMKETFIASDANVFRGVKQQRVFVISTGVKYEHSLDETVNLAELEQLTLDLISLLKQITPESK